MSDDERKDAPFQIPEAGVPDGIVPIGAPPRAGPPRGDTRAKPPRQIDKVIKVLSKSKAEAKREALRRVMRTATWTAAPPLSQPRFPETLYSPSAEVPGMLEVKPIPERDNRGARDDNSSREGSKGLTRWYTYQKEDYSDLLKRLLRSGYSKAHYSNDARRLAETEFVQIPLSWHAHIKRPYRSGDRTYFEAIHILAYVTSKYATGRFQGDMLLAPAPLLRDLFGLSEDAESAAVHYLVHHRLIGRVVILGYLPWSPTKKGSYRLLVPMFDQLIKITYNNP